MSIIRHSQTFIRSARQLVLRGYTVQLPAVVKTRGNIEKLFIKNYSSVFSKSPDYDNNNLKNSSISLPEFELICTETLEALTDYFEEIIEAEEKLVNADINYSDGVLTIKLGEKYGTYVINRQTPNRQIWLSSPKSGPKRYDLIKGHWIYKHDGISLHQLLQQEFSSILSNSVDFLKLSK